MEAHLQLDNQQQLLLLWFRVHVNIRGQEDISNALDLNREERSCETVRISSLWAGTLLGAENVMQ